MTIKQAIGTGAAIIVPALGGQAGSALLKAKSDTVRDFVGDETEEFGPEKEALVDLGCGAVVGAAVTGVGVLMKAKASRVGLFAGIGAVGGAGVAWFGKRLDIMLAEKLGDSGSATTQAAAKLRLMKKQAGGRSNNLGSPWIGGNAPGGRYEQQVGPRSNRNAPA